MKATPKVNTASKMKTTPKMILAQKMGMAPKIEMTKKMKSTKKYRKAENTTFEGKTLLRRNFTYSHPIIFPAHVACVILRTFLPSRQILFPV